MNSAFKVMNFVLKMSAAFSSCSSSAACKPTSSIWRKFGALRSTHQSQHQSPARFWFKTMKFAFKMVIFALTRFRFAFKMMIFAFKMMIFALGVEGGHDLRGVFRSVSNAKMKILRQKIWRFLCWQMMTFVRQCSLTTSLRWVKMMSLVFKTRNCVLKMMTFADVEQHCRHPDRPRWVLQKTALKLVKFALKTVGFARRRRAVLRLAEDPRVWRAGRPCESHGAGEPARWGEGGAAAAGKMKHVGDIHGVISLPLDLFDLLYAWDVHNSRFY